MTNNDGNQQIALPQKNGHTDLKAVLKDLAKNQDCNEILIEAGGRLAGSLIDADLVDELVIYTAPLLLGQGARPAFFFPNTEKLADAKRFYTHDCRIMGDDLKITYRK